MQRTTQITIATALVASIVTVGCGLSGSDNSAAKTNPRISVLYAGSMTKVMEGPIASDFPKLGHGSLAAESGGSSALAQLMKAGLKRPDVFISASPTVNDNLLLGAAHQHIEDWYATLARDELVIVYSPQSRFAGALHQAAETGDWISVLSQPGFLFGRTDPKLDPKGTRTILMMKLAAKYYHQPNLIAKLLGDVENPKQVFPEEALLSRLTTGQLDAAVAYRHEAVEWGMPYITLPGAVNLGDVQYAKLYATVSAPGAEGTEERGAPIVFTISIPANAPHPDSAVAFVDYMLQGGGHHKLLQDGFQAMDVELAGDPAKAPKSVQSLMKGVWPTASLHDDGGGQH